jgi:glycyl-tRNA synthetase
MFINTKRPLIHIMAEQKTLKELSSFLQDKGFIYGPSPEIYGGLAGFFDYGPLGKLLKNNVEAAIRKVFSQQGLFEVECPTVVPEAVWEASGHLGGFSDPLIADKAGNIFRVDNLIEEFFRENNLSLEEIKLDGASHKELLEIITKYNIKSPTTKEEFIMEIKEHNLMMKTTVGLDRIAYNRPETATTTYLPFLRYMNFFRDKLPNGVFQIGKAYRNEISPRQFMLRMREFTQAEAQLFLFKEQKDSFEKFDDQKDLGLPLFTADMQDQGTYTEFTKNFPQGITLQQAIDQNLLKNKAYAWTLALVYTLYKEMGIPQERMRLRQHNKDELAFYADDAWDLEVNLHTFGWTEMCGIHDRNDYDLTQHAKFSKTDLVAIKPDGKKEVPHVLEIAFGTDRPTFALLDLFYESKEKDEGKTTLCIPYNMAPVPICVLPLTNKLHKQAYKLYTDLQKEFITLYDKSGSVGKRYLRADSIGVPFCVTVDFDTIEKDNAVTVRDRETGEQTRVAIDKLVQTLRSLLQ